jgi:hypothetical protein
MEREPRAEGVVYKGPGLWEGCLGVVPIVAILALVSAIAVALSSRDALVGILAGLCGLVAGVVAWSRMRSISSVQPVRVLSRSRSLP